MKLHKYKIFCETDDKWEKVIKEEGQSAPTTCPVDSNHTVTAGSEAVEKVIDTEAQKDSEGALLQRNKFAPTGWHYQLHGVEFETSNLSSIYSKDEDGNDIGFTTIKCYDSNGTELTTQGDCDTDAVKTVIDWEPTYDYEIIGGLFIQQSTPSSDIRLWTVGLPDVAEGSGGNIKFTTSVNLKYMGQEKGIKVDSRASKLLKYDANNHTNKLRIILKHDAGIKHKLSIIFEIFKP